MQCNVDSKTTTKLIPYSAVPIRDSNTHKLSTHQQFELKEAIPKQITFPINIYI